MCAHGHKCEYLRIRVHRRTSECGFMQVRLEMNLLCVKCNETINVEKLSKVHMCVSVCTCMRVCVSPRHWAGCAGHQTDFPGCSCPHSE